MEHENGIWVMRGLPRNHPKRIRNYKQLVTADFRRRRNKKGETYGMAVSVLLPPETIWGYERVTSGYKETPAASWTAICGRVEDYFPKAEDDAIIKLIGKRP